MEAGEHEEGGTVNARAHGQVELVVGVDVFLRLVEQEGAAQQHGQAQEQQQDAALAFLERMVGDGDGHARGQQDQGVEERQAPRRDGLVVTTDRARAVARPAAAEARPQDAVGGAAVALAVEPRQRELARVEQRTEERGEEHHLGEDEPHHAHAERGVDLLVVVAGQRLADDVAEPLEQDRQQAGQADIERGLAPAHFVQPAGEAHHGDEQRDGGEHRPLAAMRDEIDVLAVAAVVAVVVVEVCVGVRHGGSDGSWIEVVRVPRGRRHGPGPRRGRRSGCRS